MNIGSLVKHTYHDEYGIILSILKPADSDNGTYYVVLWAGKRTADWVWDDMIVEVCISEA